MDKQVEKLAGIFTEMVGNYNDRGQMWKNIPLGKEAFEIMKALPDILPGEYDTMEDKASLLSQMLDQMDETETPRFAISVREYIAQLNPYDEDNLNELQKLRDYIDPEVTMEEYCKRYRRHLLFDPVERTERWEEIAYDVERQCDERLVVLPRGMGFCFAYWHAKVDVLETYGIEWRPPAMMNPRVMFD